MITRNISNAKNDLSRLLHLVQAGETVTILDRKKPIAKIVPIPKTGSEDLQDRLSKMAANGLVVLPDLNKDAPVDVLSFLADDESPVGAVNALLSERAEGR